MVWAVSIYPMNNPDTVQQLIAQLDDFQRRNESHREVEGRFRTLVTTSVRCANRDHFNPGHLTGSAWVVDESGGRVLLLHHGKLNRWLQPGGHADGDFNLARVALRETQEESGLTRLQVIDSEIFDLDIHEIPARGAEPAHLHFDVRYLIRADSSEELVLSDESHALAWIELVNLERYTTEESVHRMARKFAGRAGLCTRL
jgi:8-oxo-dGTP pyrophosphatase MutT (NUDIX family)